MIHSKKRLYSLDALRGLCIIGMIFVDYVGSWDNNFSILYHSDWNGFALADLIFPTFLFIVGVSMMFSLAKRKERGDSHSAIMKQVYKRTLVLIVLGLISNGFLGGGDLIESIKTIRIMGVLQRIGIVYFICALLYLKFDIRTLAYIGGGILLFYWALITLMPVPGFGMPNIDIHPKEAIANLSAWLDSVVLKGHIASWNGPFDNEGIISSIPAISTCILGMLVGSFMRTQKDDATKTSWLFVAGAVLIMFGYMWDFWYPINKLLWSGSFVIYSGGWSMVILAGFYWIIDVNGFAKWSRPFQVFGKNAVLIFTAGLSIMGLFWRVSITISGNETPIRQAIYDQIFKPLSDNPQITSIMYPIAIIIFWYGVSYLLDKKKIYLRA